MYRSKIQINGKPFSNYNNLCQEQEGEFKDFYLEGYKSLNIS